MPDDQKSAQLQTIEQSKFYIAMIMAGILLSYNNLNLQEKEILCGEESEELPFFRMGASILIITALVYFFCLLEQTIQESPTPENGKNFAASLFTLVAALLRFPKENDKTVL